MLRTTTRLFEFSEFELPKPIRTLVVITALALSGCGVPNEVSVRIPILKVTQIPGQPCKPMIPRMDTMDNSAEDTNLEVGQYEGPIDFPTLKGHGKIVTDRNESLPGTGCVNVIVVTVVSACIEGQRTEVEKRVMAFEESEFAQVTDSSKSIKC